MLVSLPMFRILSARLGRLQPCARYLNERLPYRGSLAKPFLLAKLLVDNRVEYGGATCYYYNIVWLRDQ